MVPRHSYRGLWVITSYHYSDLRIHRNRIRQTRMIYHEAGKGSIAKNRNPRLRRAEGPGVF